MKIMRHNINAVCEKFTVLTIKAGLQMNTQN